MCYYELLSINILNVLNNVQNYSISLFIYIHVNVIKSSVCQTAVTFQ